MCVTETYICIYITFDGDITRQMRYYQTDIINAYIGVIAASLRSALHKANNIMKIQRDFYHFYTTDSSFLCLFVFTIYFTVLRVVEVERQKFPPEESFFVHIFATLHCFITHTRPFIYF